MLLNMFLRPSFLTWGADHSLLLPLWFPESLAAYSVWTQNTSACLLIHYSRKRKRGNNTVRSETCKGLQPLYVWKRLDRWSDTGKPHKTLLKAQEIQCSAAKGINCGHAGDYHTTPKNLKRAVYIQWKVCHLTSHSTIAILSRSSEMNMSFWATWARSVSTFTHSRRQQTIDMRVFVCFRQ